MPELLPSAAGVSYHDFEISLRLLPPREETEDGFRTEDSLVEVTGRVVETDDRLPPHRSGQVWKVLPPDDLTARNMTPEMRFQLSIETGNLLLPPDSEIRHRFVSELITAEKQGYRVRVRIVCHDSLLETVPWELAEFNAEPAGIEGALVLDPRISMMRRGLPGPGQSPIEQRPPISVLHVDFSGWQREGWEYPRDALVHNKGGWTELQRAMESGESIVDITAHGVQVSVNDDIEWGLKIRDKNVTAREFVRHIDPKQKRLVILAACNAGIADNWAGFGATLLRHGVGAVISMQTKVDDGNMRRFVIRLLEVLKDGGSIDAAVQMARKRVDERKSLDDWWVPVFHSVHPNSVRFDTRHSSATPGFPPNGRTVRPFNTEFEGGGSSQTLAKASFGLLSTGDSLTALGQMDGALVTRSFHDSESWTGWHQFDRRSNVTISPTGRVAGSLLGSSLELATLDNFDPPKFSAWARFELDVEGSSPRLLAVAEPGLRNLSYCLALISTESYTELILLDQRKQQIVTIERKPSRSSAGVILNDDVLAVTEEGLDHWGMARRSLDAYLKRLPLVNLNTAELDCAVVGGRPYLLATTDRRIFLLPPEASTPALTRAIDDDGVVILARSLSQLMSKPTKPRTFVARPLPDGRLLEIDLDTSIA